MKKSRQKVTKIFAGFYYYRLLLYRHHFCRLKFSIVIFGEWLKFLPVFILPTFLYRLTFLPTIINVDLRYVRCGKLTLVAFLAGCDNSHLPTYPNCIFILNLTKPSRLKRVSKILHSLSIQHTNWKLNSPFTRVSYTSLIGLSRDWPITYPPP